MKKVDDFLRGLSVLLLVISLGYFLFKINTIKIFNKPKQPVELSFLTNRIQVEDFVRDSTYYFNVVVKNKANDNLNYDLISTCGCTVVGDIKSSIPSNWQDTLNISVSTYNRGHSFKTDLLLYNESTLIDSLSIFMIEGNNIKND